MCVLKWFIVPFMKLFVYESKGFKNIPKQGPAILVANHSSYIDAVLMRYFPDWFAGRLPRGIQSREWVEKSWFRRFLFLTILRQIPTNGSISKALEALTHGEMLMLFPEGGRSPDGKMQKCEHTGLGLLAEVTGVPVIPIGIEGTYKWWPKQKFLPTFRPRCIAIRAGKPMKFKGKQSKKNFLDFQRKVMQKVAKLAKTKYTY